MHGEDPGNGGGDGVRISALDVVWDLVITGREEVGVDEDERGGAPNGAPSAGEHDGARGVLDGEARDDVTEDDVGEGAEPIDASAVTVSVEEDAEIAVEGDGRVGDHVVGVGEQATHECFLLLRAHAPFASHGPLFSSRDDARRRRSPEERKEKEKRPGGLGFRRLVNAAESEWFCFVL
ncbi:hypothetical protein PR202_ga30355 [Eleusine coracana subsp. coracana]|uniref:Uncharacterized protein n=1 Tax=Eleusine coracana subsp. coracana TaxID=191504 RepID=A0AAV5DPI7_ELECO|nr:hypothetical protein PR202_ga30355 [Eleusine coracana subsp. coracana]